MLKSIKSSNLFIHSLIALSIVTPTTFCTPEPAQAIGFAATCQPPVVVRFYQPGPNWRAIINDELQGWCTRSDRVTQIFTRITLTDLLVNVSSVLFWRRGGGFSYSCNKPEITYHSQQGDVAIMRMWCRSGPEQGDWDYINVSEKINNWNGSYVAHSIPR